MPTQPKYPVSVQKLTTGNTELDRIQTNIISPLTATLQTLNASPTVNWIYMGSINTTLSSAGYNNLRVDTQNTFYYINEVNTYLVAMYGTVYSSNSGTTANFRIINAIDSSILWTAPPQNRGTVQVLGTWTPGVYTLLANTPYVVQMNSSAGGIDGSAAMKVSY